MTGAPWSPNRRDHRTPENRILPSHWTLHGRVVHVPACDPADAEAILVVHVAPILATGPETYSDRQVAAWAAKPEGAERYLDAIASESTEVVVAAADERVLGLGGLDVERGEIESVFVDPDATGAGIGSAIVERFERRLRSNGFAVARLRAVLNAVGGYEARG